MTFFIILAIVIALVIFFNKASRNVEIEKIKNAMSQRLKEGASPEQVLSEFVTLTVQQFGRPLTAQELNKLRETIKQVIPQDTSVQTEQQLPIAQPQEVISPEQRQADLEGYMERLAQGKVEIKIALAPVPIILKPREDAKFVIPGVVLQEPRAIRTSKGYYGGPSVRVTKGVYFRVGRFSSSSQSHEELKTIDTGVLTVTDERIIFAGGMKTIQIELKKLLSMDPFSDGIGIHKEGRERTQYFLWSEGMIKAQIVANNHNYTEPFTGLFLKNAIEGLIRKG